MVDEHLHSMSRRVRRVAQLLQREVSSILLELKDPRIHFCTLTKVLPARDLRSARVCVSVYGTKEEQEETIRSLRHASGYIQHLVAVRLRMKFTPVLFFVTDPSIEHSDRISRILKELNISSDIDESTNGSNNSFDDGSEDPDITVSETDGEDVEE